MFRSIRTWMLMALPAAGLLLAPLAGESEAAPRKRTQARVQARTVRPGVAVRPVKRGTTVTPYGTARIRPDGPVEYNTTRAYFYTPRVNPIPPFGYYGSQQYSSQWIPSGFYNFR